MKKTSMRSPIPKPIREKLAGDPFMYFCIVEHGCEGRVHWDHAFTYRGKRVNELWSILPLCRKHNMGVTKHVQTLRRMNLRARIHYFHAKEQFLKDYPRSDLFKV